MNGNRQDPNGTQAATGQREPMMRPPSSGWLARGVSVVRRAVARRLQRAPEQVRSRDDLRRIVRQSKASGVLHEPDSAMLAGVLVFHEKKARDVMRPRTEIVALAEDATADELWALLRSERYSRYPVYRDSLDDVIGVF